MEMQNLVKVKVFTLDLDAEPIQVTVASVNGCVSGEQVFKKVCDSLGLKEASRANFSLFEKRDQPVCRYRLKEEISLAHSELFLGKWCFVGTHEKDMIHLDPVAAHLVFLQAQHDLHSGKFNMSEEEKQQLDECLEPGFTAEEQYILLCQKQNNYFTLHLPQCTLQKQLVTPAGTLRDNSMVNVSLSKYGVKLVGDQTATFTWFEVSRWKLDRRDSTLTLTWMPAEGTEPSDVPLRTPQVELLLAGIVEMITVLQKTDSPDSSFHADMISQGDDGSTVWENSLYNPARASAIQFSV